MDNSPGASGAPQDPRHEPSAEAQADTMMSSTAADREQARGESSGSGPSERENGSGVGGEREEKGGDEGEKSEGYRGRRKPIVVIVVGMAGSGKTTLMQRLCSHVSTHGVRSYVVNLDPAVLSVPYPANIDIRDTVNYKNVMKEYRLGPNGGIVTSLNLFATKIHEVLQLVERRADSLDVVLLDTPGQIEIFTWSASGAIITEAFASTFPTVIAYVVDTPRSTAPPTFMSNMLYACGILYKTKLPLLLTFNKVDVAKHEFALEWMEDYQKFQAALDDFDESNPVSSYSSSLYRSLCLVLDEFYRNLTSVGVSAITGAGIPDFFKAVDAAGEEFGKGYGAELQRRRDEKEAAEELRRKTELLKFREDAKEEAKIQGKRKEVES